MCSVTSVNLFSGSKEIKLSYNYSFLSNFELDLRSSIIRKYQNKERILELSNHIKASIGYGLDYMDDKMNIESSIRLIKSKSFINSNCNIVYKCEIENISK